MVEQPAVRNSLQAVELDIKSSSLLPRLYVRPKIGGA